MNPEVGGIESFMYEFFGIICVVLKEKVYLEYSPALEVPVLSTATIVDVNFVIAS